MPKKLSDSDMDELKNWLLSLNVNITKLHREFSDVRPTALIVKQHFPKLVDLFNYPGRNSIQLKFNNWEAFNFKVLRKLDMVQSRRTLEDIARAVPGAIETVLHSLLLRIKNRKEGDAEMQAIDSKVEKAPNNEDFMVITINKTVGNSVLQVPQKMVSHTMYQSVVNDSKAKDSHLEAANQKITHLENILKMKDDQIKELNQQLLKYSSPFQSAPDLK